MRARRSARVMAVLLSSAVAFGGATGTAYAEDPPPTTSTSDPAPQPSEPAPEPTAEPTSEPTAEPAAEPTSEPSPEPTSDPLPEPAAEPTVKPTTEPTARPVSDPAAEAPTDEDSAYGQEASINSPLTSDVVLPSESCRTLGLAAGCDVYLDLGTVEYLANSLVDIDCSSPSSACTAAVAAAKGAVALAATCVHALELGVTVADLAVEGEPGVGLDCAYAARTAMETAAKAIAAVNDCTTSQTAVCVTVYEAVAMATDRALGCINGALAQAGVNAMFFGGTDTGCGNAVYVLQGAATQLAGLVQNCAAGGGFCATLTQVSQFLLDELPGCTNALVVAVQSDFVAPPFPAGGGYTCYAVLDQVNIWLSEVSDVSPSVPYQLSPTSDCSVTVPGVPGTTGMPHNMLIPACEVPVDTGWVRTPAVMMPGRECQYEKWVEEAENYATRFQEKDRATHHNRSKTMSWRWVSGYNETLSSEWSWQFATEAEAKMLFAKVKASATVALKKSMSYTFEEKIDMVLAPNHVGVAAFGFARWVQSGIVHERFEDCSTAPVKKITIRAPYDHSGWSDQKPYQAP